MILLPTKGRPHLLSRFFECCKETEVTEPILLIFDGDDRNNYEPAYKMPFPVMEMVVQKGTPLGGCFNAAYEKYPNEAYYGLVSDDCTPETPRWDVKLKEAARGKIAWPAEGIHNEKLPGFVFICGDIVRKMGFICPPSIKHWFTDNLWNAIQLKMGIGNYLPHVMLRHRHFINGLAPEDDTYKSQPDHDADGKAYAAFLENDFAGLCERLAA
jgi:hypothetical protein